MAWYQNFIGTYMDPIGTYLISFRIISFFWGWGWSIGTLVVGVLYGILPTFVSEFVVWLFSTNVFRPNWIRVTWGWIGRFTGWW